MGRDDISRKIKDVPTSPLLENATDNNVGTKLSTNLAEVGTDVPDINVGELISRQAAIDALRGYLVGKRCPDDGTLTCRLIENEVINKLPSAQPKTAKRIVGKSRDGMTLWYQCDMCNEPVDVQDNYCRGCGRRLIDE